LELDVE